MSALEDKRFGINHEEVGAAMFREWKLPEDFAEAVQNVWKRPNAEDSLGLPLLMRAVVRIDRGSNSAASSKMSVVVSDTSLSTPPITPPRATAFSASAITHVPLDNSYCL